MKKANNLIVRLVQMFVGHSHKGMSKRHRAMRHTLGIVLGIVIILVGTAIAGAAHHVNHYSMGLSVDALGYFIHAVGCVPILRNIEPLWSLIVE